MLNELDVESCVTELKAQLRSLGPCCSVDTYMNVALFSEHLGFYNAQDPLKSRHFITGITHVPAYRLALAQWVQDRQVDLVVELGAGTGQLAQEVKKLCPNLPYYILEKSSYHRELQQQILGSSCQWAEDLQEIPAEENVLVLLHEVLDCFPAKSYVWQHQQVMEHKVNTTTWELELFPVHDLEVVAYAENLAKSSGLERFVFMQGKEDKILLQSLKQRFVDLDVLIVDYGDEPGYLVQKHQDRPHALRAYQAGAVVDCDFSKPGACDLTYDLDFFSLMTTWLSLEGTVEFYGTQERFMSTQTNFLSQASLQRRLILDPHWMGQAFKFLVLKS